MKKLILLLLVITAISTGCKKYPDGPLISFYTAKGRLYGFHTLTKYTVNGVDSLNLYSDSLCTTFDFYNNTDNGNDYCSMSGRRKDGLGTNFYWEWELVNHNKIFKVLVANGASQGVSVFQGNITPEWQILKLKWNDIILQTTYNGKEYLIELTR